MKNNQVRNTRISLKLTQEKFGELIGVSASTIQSYELGRRDIAKAGAAVQLLFEKAVKRALYPPLRRRKARPL